MDDDNGECVEPCWLFRSTGANFPFRVGDKAQQLEHQLVTVIVSVVLYSGLLFHCVKLAVLQSNHVTMTLSSTLRVVR